MSAKGRAVCARLGHYWVGGRIGDRICGTCGVTEKEDMRGSGEASAGARGDVGGDSGGGGAGGAHADHAGPAAADLGDHGSQEDRVGGEGPAREGSGLEVVWDREWLDGLTIRAAKHECDGHAPCWKELTLAAGDEPADEWFVFADGMARTLDLADSGLEPAAADEILAMIEDVDAPVFLRAIAVFGLPWRRITARIGEAMMRTLATAPPWWAEEFMHWEPGELRALRGNVSGGQESFVRAMRAIRTYRLSTDRLPPLRAL